MTLVIAYGAGLWGALETQWGGQAPHHTAIYSGPLLRTS